MSFLAKFSQTSTKADVNALSNPINKCEGTLMRIFFSSIQIGKTRGENYKGGSFPLRCESKEKKKKKKK
jgi:hypothetical protein